MNHVPRIFKLGPFFPRKNVTPFTISPYKDLETTHLLHAVDLRIYGNMPVSRVCIGQGSSSLRKIIYRKAASQDFPSRVVERWLEGKLHGICRASRSRNHGPIPSLQDNSCKYHYICISIDPVALHNRSARAIAVINNS